MVKPSYTLKALVAFNPAGLCSEPSKDYLPMAAGCAMFKVLSINSSLIHSALLSACEVPWSTVKATGDTIMSEMTCLFPTASPCGEESRQVPEQQDPVPGTGVNKREHEKRAVSHWRWPDSQGPLCLCGWARSVTSQNPSTTGMSVK
jgi:hypothetical protein